MEHRFQKKRSYPDSLHGRPALQDCCKTLQNVKLLQRFAPACVIIDPNLDILYFYGATGPFLNPATGSATLNVLRIVRSELYISLKQTIEQAVAAAQETSTEVKFHEHGEIQVVRVTAIPVQEPLSSNRCLIITFQQIMAPPKVSLGNEEPVTLDPHFFALGQRNEELERELILTKQYLQTSIQEKETANEELKSAVEELQSANEELQSTNEELETSKEEMQSSNEELTTVNEELQNRMDESSRINDDLHNILSSSQDAAIIVGMDLRLRHYTAVAAKLLNVIPGDVGREIAFVNKFFGSLDLSEKVSSVVSSLVSYEADVRCGDGCWYSIYVTPYKTLDHKIQGAVISFVDIDVRRRATQLTQDTADYLGNLLASVAQPLAVIDQNMWLIWANGDFLSLFNIANSKFRTTNLAVVLGGRLLTANLRKQLQTTITSAVPFRQCSIKIESIDGATPYALEVSGNVIPGLLNTPILLLSCNKKSA